MFSWFLQICTRPGELYTFCNLSRRNKKTQQPTRIFFPNVKFYDSANTFSHESSSEPLSHHMSCNEVSWQGACAAGKQSRVISKQPRACSMFNSHCANMAEDRPAPRSPPAVVPPPGHGEVPMSEPAIRNLIREEVAAAVTAALAQPPTSSAPGERHSLR